MKISDKEHEEIGILIAELARKYHQETGKNRREFSDRLYEFLINGAPVSSKSDIDTSTWPRL